MFFPLFKILPCRIGVHERYDMGEFSSHTTGLPWPWLPVSIIHLKPAVMLDGARGCTWVGTSAVTWVAHAVIIHINESGLKVLPVLTLTQHPTCHPGRKEYRCDSGVTHAQHDIAGQVWPRRRQCQDHNSRSQPRWVQQWPGFAVNLPFLTQNWRSLTSPVGSASPPSYTMRPPPVLAAVGSQESLH